MKRPLRFAVFALAGAAACGAAGWYGLHAYRGVTEVKDEAMPTVKVTKGDVTLTVTVKGDLRGGNPETLTAPTTGGADMHLTELRTTGEPIKSGEVVAQFDTTEQEYKLKEAEADLAEAEAKILQAKAQREAQDEEDRYALSKAESDVKVAELEARRNPLLPSITAKENTLALDAAKEHFTQLSHNIANRKLTGAASIAIQEAGRNKADSQAKTARQNIEAMTLKAHRDGYVSVKLNSGGNMMFWGMTLPLFQVGDTVRPGMGVAEIPDLKNWEMSADIGELDRGHLSPGQHADISVIAMPGRTYKGSIKEIGGTTGPPWNRHASFKIRLEDPSIELRPGMSATAIITTDQMKGVLSLPAQALFESDGRSFVYLKNGASFTAKDVTLVRRNEMRVVVSGIDEGRLVALSNPTEVAKKKTSSGNAIDSMHK